VILRVTHLEHGRYHRWNRATRVFFHAAIWRARSPLRHSPGASGANLLTNGDFSNGDADWSSDAPSLSHSTATGAYCITVPSGQVVNIGWPNPISTATWSRAVFSVCRLSRPIPATSTIRLAIAVARDTSCHARLSSPAAPTVTKSRRCAEATRRASRCHDGPSVRGLRAEPRARLAVWRSRLAWCCLLTP
jgi:hypothetical protein